MAEVEEVAEAEAEAEATSSTSPEVGADAGAKRGRPRPEFLFFLFFGVWMAEKLIIIKKIIKLLLKNFHEDNLLYLHFMR